MAQVVQVTLGHPSLPQLLVDLELHPFLLDLVFQVFLGVRLCQECQVAQHNQKRRLQLCQMMTGWIQGDQEVLEALVDLEDP